MTRPRRTPIPGIMRLSLHSDEADAAIHQQTQKQTQTAITPGTEGEVVVCRSARLTLAAYRFYRAILLAFVEHGRAGSLAARSCHGSDSRRLSLLWSADPSSRDPLRRSQRGEHRPE
jgi:hypothetical protein